MRILSVLTCCFGLALFAGAAQQQDDNQNSQNKKKGGNAPKQAVTTAPATLHGPQHYNANLHGQGTGPLYKKGTGYNGPTNMGANLNSSKSNKFSSQTKFNKTTTINKNVTINKNYKIQKFNLQTNKINTSYKTVKFNQNYKIAGAQHWKGAKYQVFVNYHPVWQNQWWWGSHYNHIVFVFGGWYYWDNYYWYPAWGYAPDSVYYFDGPIYASNPDYDPGQVVANVQSALQQQGYYQGEIDGILGPQTRAALAEYQAAQNLEPTGAVDEPTLEALGMA